VTFTGSSEETVIDGAQLAAVARWGAPGNHDRLLTQCADRIRRERLHEDEAIYLRTELCIPEAFSFEAITYDLESTSSDLAGVTYAVYGTRIIDRWVAGPRILVERADGQTLEMHGNLGMQLKILPSSLFIDMDGSLTVCPGPPEALGLDLDAMRSDGRIATFELLTFSERINRQRSAAVAERRWHPSIGLIEGIRWSERPTNMQEVVQAYEDFPLFEQLAKLPPKLRGRPRRPRALDLHAAVSAARRLLVEHPDVQPTFLKIVDVLAETEQDQQLSAATVNSRWDRHIPPIRMPEVLSRALE
jgi:hypothetical protein